MSKEKEEAQERGGNDMKRKKIESHDQRPGPHETVSPSFTAMMDEGRRNLALFLGLAFTLTEQRDERRDRKEKRREKTTEEREGKDGE